MQLRRVDIDDKSRSAVPKKERIPEALILESLRIGIQFHKFIKDAWIKTITDVDKAVRAKVATLLLIILFNYVWYSWTYSMCLICRLIIRLLILWYLLLYTLYQVWGGKSKPSSGRKLPMVYSRNCFYKRLFYAMQMVWKNTLIPFSRYRRVFLDQASSRVSLHPSLVHCIWALSKPLTHIIDKKL